MACIPGNQYILDSFLEKTICSTISSQKVQIKNIVSGQILTFRSGQNAWINPNYDIYQIDPSAGLTWVLQSGTNLYTQAFGLEPSSVSGSGLPSGLTLFNFNTIIGIPTKTGTYNCKLFYKYCNDQFTGISRQIIINVCTGDSQSVPTYIPVFPNALGPKFNYDPIVEYSNKCLNGSELLSIVSGQRLVLQSGVSAWVYPEDLPNYSFITGGRLFTLLTGSNLYNTSTGIFPRIISGSLPLGLGYKDYCTITGIPTTTGEWSCLVRFGYCDDIDSSGTVYGKINQFTLQVIPPEKIDYTEGAVYLAFTNFNTIPYNLTKVKNLNFYYNQNNQFIKYFDQISGYGNISKIIDFNNTNQISYGNINNPTGYLPALTYQTGKLSGIVLDGLSSYTWSNINITGTGSAGKVYLDQITGYKQAQNVITFNTGLLIDNDLLNIKDINFYYRTTENLGDSYYNFDSLSRLVNVLNSGATGAYSETDNYLQNYIGITGYVNGSNIYLFSYLSSGEEGNAIKIYRETQNLDSIKIPYRYFQSGQTLRIPSNRWSGLFSTTYSTITKENSGIYTYNYTDDNFYGNISGLLWVDTFSGNYYITTGLYNTLYPLNISTGLVPFINNQNIYSGSCIIKSGQSSIQTGFSISIRKPNYYNISGNIAQYIVSGENFIYSGLIEG